MFRPTAGLPSRQCMWCTASRLSTMAKRSSQGNLEKFFKPKRTRVAAVNMQARPASSAHDGGDDTAAAASALARQQQAMWGTAAPLPLEGAAVAASDTTFDSDAAGEAGEAGVAATIADAAPSRVAPDSADGTASIPAEDDLKSSERQIPVAGPFAAAKGMVTPTVNGGEASPAALAEPPTEEAQARWHDDATRLQAVADAAVMASSMGNMHPQLREVLVEPTWQTALGAEFDKPYMDALQTFLDSEWESHAVYPPATFIFRALNSCPISRCKVVILGQDPYHNTGQAVGLSFSVPRGVAVPSSLQNIFKELNADLGCSHPGHGDLLQWAEQGVLMLNTCLTVRGHSANSHAKKGWEKLTDKVITTISARRRGVVFIFWGKPAQKKASLINRSHGHHTLMCAHPSGLSAHRGFFGCRHFSQTNQLLEASGMAPIKWQL